MARTKEYELERVLDQAIHLFWLRGYGATSIEDLIAATGLSRSSLYAELGSKRGLFSAATERYLRDKLERLGRIGPGGLDDIIRYFREIAQEHDPGCMIINAITELAPDDSDFQADIARYLSAIRQAFTRALEVAEAEGQTEVGRVPARAEFLKTQLLGLLVELRSRIRLSPVESTTESTIAVVESWRLRSLKQRLGNQ